MKFLTHILCSVLAVTLLACATHAEHNVMVLAYHPRIDTGDSYETNELIAFNEDLRLLNESGFQIVPLVWVSEWISGGRDIPENSVAITFDDGADATLAFLEAMEVFQLEVAPQQPHLHATTFVIASPAARADIGGEQDLADNWWRIVEESPLMSIENHSWDHNHPSVETKCDDTSPDEHGFRVIDEYSEATCEVALASTFIRDVTGRRPIHFAYPYGQSSYYLRETYLPEFSGQHGITAAFSTAGRKVSSDSSIWNVPRFVHRWHWEQKSQLAELLREQ